MSLLTAADLQHDWLTGMALSQLTVGPTTHWWLFSRVPEEILASPKELKAALDAKQIPLLAKTPSENISVRKPQYEIVVSKHKWYRNRLVVAGPTAHPTVPIPGIISPDSLVSRPLTSRTWLMLGSWAGCWAKSTTPEVPCAWQSCLSGTRPSGTRRPRMRATQPLPSLEFQSPRTG